MKQTKKSIIPATLCGMAVLAIAGTMTVATTGCKSPAGNAQDSIVTPGNVETKAIAYERNDSVLEKGSKTTYIRFTANADVDWPTDGNGKAAAAVRSYIAEKVLNGAKLTDDGETMVRQAVDAVFDTLHKEATASKPHGFEHLLSYKKAYECDGYVTFEGKFYAYNGGNHGESQAVGDTYRKTDGKRFENDLLKADAATNKALKRMLLDALQQKFGVTSDAELAKKLGNFVAVNEEEFPLPKQHPYLLKDGVAFVYQEYEIASHAEGQSLVVIPFQAMRPFLSDEAINMLGE